MDTLVQLKTWFGEPTRREGRTYVWDFGIKASLRYAKKIDKVAKRHGVRHTYPPLIPGKKAVFSRLTFVIS